MLLSFGGSSDALCSSMLVIGKRARFVIAKCARSKMSRCSDQEECRDSFQTMVTTQYMIRDNDFVKL